VKLIFDGAIDEMKMGWGKAGIDKNLIDWFNDWHAPRVSRLFKIVDEIFLCPDNCPNIRAGNCKGECILERKQRIANILVLVLYQTVTDALKVDLGHLPTEEKTQQTQKKKLTIRQK